MVDIYTGGIVPNADKRDAEGRLEEILQQYEKYGKILQWYVQRLTLLSSLPPA